MSSINNSRGLTLTNETILNYKHDSKTNYSKVSEHIGNIFLELLWF